MRGGAGPSNLLRGKLVARPPGASQSRHDLRVKDHRFVTGELLDAYQAVCGRATLSRSDTRLLAFIEEN